MIFLDFCTAIWMSPNSNWQKIPVLTVIVHGVPALPSSVPVCTHTTQQGIFSLITEVLSVFLQTALPRTLLTGVMVFPEQRPEELFMAWQLFWAQGPVIPALFGKVHLNLHLWVVHNLNGNLVERYKLVCWSAKKAYQKVVVLQNLGFGWFLEHDNQFKIDNQPKQAWPGPDSQVQPSRQAWRQVWTT